MPPVWKVVARIEENIPAVVCVLSKSQLRGVYTDPPRREGSGRDHLKLPRTVNRRDLLEENRFVWRCTRNLGRPEPFARVVVPPIELSVVWILE